jgi:hypothetical protein
MRALAILSARDRQTRHPVSSLPGRALVRSNRVAYVDSGAGSASNNCRERTTWSFVPGTRVVRRCRCRCACGANWFSLAEPAKSAASSPTSISSRSSIRYQPPTRSIVMPCCHFRIPERDNFRGASLHWSDAHALSSNRKKLPSITKHIICHF